MQEEERRGWVALEGDGCKESNGSFHDVLVSMNRLVKVMIMKFCAMCDNSVRLIRYVFFLMSHRGVTRNVKLPSCSSLKK